MTIVAYLAAAMVLMSSAMIVRCQFDSYPTMPFSSGMLVGGYGDPIATKIGTTLVEPSGGGWTRREPYSSNVRGQGQGQVHVGEPSQSQPREWGNGKDQGRRASGSRRNFPAGRTNGRGRAVGGARRRHPQRDTPTNRAVPHGAGRGMARGRQGPPRQRLSSTMQYMICRETPSSFREMPCNPRRRPSCPFPTHLHCVRSFHSPFPTCCARTMMSAAVVDKMM